MRHDSLRDRAHLLGQTALVPRGFVAVNDALVDHAVDDRAWHAASAAAASSCLPALSARVALRMALRSCEVRASLRARCAVDCRAAFSADFVFAKRRLLEGRWGQASAPKRAA